VVNACLDRIRRRQAHPTVPLPDGSRSDDRPSGVEPAAPMHDHDTALMVRAALAALPVDQRAAIVLVDVQGYPVAEAAEMLGVAEGTIKSRCARGRARMAGTLKHLHGDGPGVARDGEPGRGGEAGGGVGHSNAGDTGHAGAGNHGAAESVPSGPAAHGSRPGAQDRRDQR